MLKPRFAADEAHARFDDALAIYQTEYAKINGRHTRLYPDVAAGLDALRAAGIRLACVTNKPHRFAVELLEQYGLADCFGIVLGGDSVARKKPDPLPMLTACNALGVAPDAAVAIGDSENDALAGARGMATLTVPYGYNHGKATNDKFGWYSRFVAGRSSRNLRAQRRPANPLIISSICMFLNKTESEQHRPGSLAWRRWSR